ncbi:hypothetical protein ACLKA7_000672 [Drosophila subpalustris]
MLSKSATEKLLDIKATEALRDIEIIEDVCPDQMDSGVDEILDDFIEDAIAIYSCRRGCAAQTEGVEHLIGCLEPHWMPRTGQSTADVFGHMYHRGLDIPVAPQDTHMNLIEQMRASAYLSQVQKQIAQEQERMARLKNRASQLDKQIKVLIDDSVTLLKVRMNELGINVNSPMI